MVSLGGTSLAIRTGKKFDARKQVLGLTGCFGGERWKSHYFVTLHVCHHTMQGEQLEDDIIDIATLLRQKADAMVAETGGVNFKVIQPMIDEISVLKGKYR